MLLGEHCRAERDGRGMRRERRTLVCWAQHLKVPSLGVKVGNQEGFPTGYGSVIAGKQISRSFGPETPCDFWDRCPPPPHPTPKLRRSFYPPTVSGAFTQAHPFSFPFVGSQLPCCGRWKSSPSQAYTASLGPLIPGRQLLHGARLNRALLRAPSASSQSVFWRGRGEGLALPNFGFSTSVLNCSNQNWTDIIRRLIWLERGWERISREWSDLG